MYVFVCVGALARVRLVTLHHITKLRAHHFVVSPFLIHARLSMCAFVVIPQVAAQSLVRVREHPDALDAMADVVFYRHHVTLHNAIYRHMKHLQSLTIDLTVPTLP
jgi:hypothetical protein